MSERSQAVINGRGKMTGYKNILNTIYLIKFRSKFGGWVLGKNLRCGYFCYPRDAIFNFEIKGFIDIMLIAITEKSLH